MTHALRHCVTYRQPPRRIALAGLVAVIVSFGSVPSARAQRAAGGKPLPVVLELEFKDLTQANISPLLWTLWSYVASESRATESQGFGLGVAPHFGRADISTFARLSAWAAVGGAATVLAAYAPSLQHPYVPSEALFLAGYGSIAGVVAGELAWRGLRADATGTSPLDPLAIEVTLAAVRIEYVSTPIDLPTVTYAWVPALVGRW